MASGPVSTPVYKAITIVDSIPLIKDVIAKLNTAGTMAVDCEGRDLGRGGTLDILSVATKDKEVYLFDISALGRGAFDAGLRALLENKEVEKMMFDCRGDADALKHLFGVMLDGVLDVQLLEVIHRQKKEPKKSPPPFGSPAYWNYIENNYTVLFGLKKCFLTYLNSEELVLSKKNITMKMDADREKNIWSARPLDDSLQEYCANDTCTLFSLYDVLKEDTDIDFLRTASARYVDFTRSYSCLPLEKYIFHAILPHHILEAGRGFFSICTGCKKQFGRDEFSKNQLTKKVQVCRVCRVIDHRIVVADNRYSNFRLREERDEEHYQNTYYSDSDSY